MGLSCGAKVLKYCLFGFNLIFFVAGCICLGIGIFLIVDEHAMDKLIKATADQGQPLNSQTHSVQVRDLGVVMAVGGTVILVIAFLGCCGAVKEWRPLLVLYAICLMIILAVEIAAAIFAGVNRNNLQVAVKNVLNDSLVRYNGTSAKPSLVRNTWDNFMREHNCCGVVGNSEKSLHWHNEFKTSGWYNISFLRRHRERQVRDPPEDFYPDACCDKSKVESINRNPKNDDDPVCYKKNIRNQGCYDILREGLENKLDIIIGVGVAVGLIQLIGIVFSLCLCRAITNEYIVN